ncbi:pleckstrin homology domain-containing family A member 8-like [Amblyomma americanum]|uniref:Pleckstrin homology domain-containing family A member 8 n=1 Tax=Amblyomma americanum TaxID=6943 RepID=A0AAQ4FEU3_AMBAM
MEGVLWKWTNYWNGWQPRWFILDKGILTYYKSQDEVNQGCKGSVKVSACEIVVHPTDSRRLDLVIPSEQHFYLRAPTPSERQQWLVALGSSKAATAAAAGGHATQPPRLGGGDPEGSLRAKKAELRLYCDLLMQQVHTIKTSTGASGDEAAKASEAADLLRATCDTFIATLEDCMRLADANFTYELPHQEVRDSALPHEAPPPVAPVVPKSLQSAHPSSSRRRRKSNSISSSSGASSSVISTLDRHQRAQRVDPSMDSALCSASAPPSSATSPTGCASTSSPSSVSSSHVLPANSVPLPNGAESTSHTELLPTTTINPPVFSAKQPSPVVNGSLLSHPSQPRTFFSVMEHSFIDLTSSASIPTEPFLDSCRSILSVFDVLGSTAFVPVKMDIQGNIGKLQAKFDVDPPHFNLLLNIVQQEVDTGTNSNRNSATDALLWLARALAFIHAFLEQIHSGNPVLTDCASVAYGATLKCHHGWVVRSIFAVALRAMPELEPFLEAMAPSPEDFEHPEYRRQLFTDCGAYLLALKRVLDTLNNFYVENELEPPVQRP